MDNRLYISVIGASECAREEAEIAEAVGRELARRGAILVCGGHGGVMEAACRGAKEEGGMTVGILPEVDHRRCNPYIDVAIVTGLGWARNSIVVLTGQAVIAIGGAYGTLSEIAFARIYNKAVIGIGTWKLEASRFNDPEIIVAISPVEAVDTALRAAKRFQCKELE